MKNIKQKVYKHLFVFKIVIYLFNFIYLLYIVDLQSWEKKIAEEKELEYDNEEDVEVEEKISVSYFFININDFIT